MSKKSVTFVGVQVSEDFLTGYIPSADIIDNFDKSWIPDYQRARVDSTKKINDLKAIFTEGKKIDGVKINLEGKAYKRGDKYTLEGEFSIPDGQQRILALVESKVRDYNLPVELYINSEEPEQVELFQQFNLKQTKIGFGDIAKSVQGPYGDLLRTLLKKRVYPVPIVVNGKSGVNLSVFCPILYMVHRKINDAFVLRDYKKGKPIIEFFKRGDKETPISMAEYAVRKMFEAYVGIFGEYDPSAVAYKRAFLMSWFKIVSEHFLQEDGCVNFGKFKPRFRQMPTKLLNSSVVRENIGGSSSDAMYEVSKMIVSYLNRGLQTGRLPVPLRRLEGADEDLKETPKVDEESHKGFSEGVAMAASSKK